MARKSLIIHNPWALGDTVCLSALFRDIHKARPGEFDIYSSGHYKNVFWRNNPYCSPAPEKHKGQLIKLEYLEGIRSAGRGAKIHFLSWFHRDFKDKTKIDVPVTLPKGDIHLSQAEKDTRLVSYPYWVIVAGGKKDMTGKVWSYAHWQRTIDMLAVQGIRCVQAGAEFHNHFHPKLLNVESTIGKTDSERMFFSLIYHAQGVICGVTAAMHIAAVFDKPCVVLAGGREEPWWEAYTNAYRPESFGTKCAPVEVEHTFLHTVGLLDCGIGNLAKGCWRDRTVPLDHADHNNAQRKRRLCKKPVQVGSQYVPECMRMITPDHVVEAVMNYYQKGILPPIGTPVKSYSLPVVDVAPPKPEPVEIKNPLVAKVAAPPVVPQPAPKEERDWAAETWQDSWNKAVPVMAAPRGPEAPGFAVLDHPYIGGRFTLFVLGFGDNLGLMQRCVESIVNTCPEGRFDLRVALNQPNNKLSDYVGTLVETKVVTKVYTDYGARRKYPAMREMFWDKLCPITTPYVCWFDDDSWCRQKDWMIQLAQLIIANHPQQGRLYGAKMVHDIMPYRKSGRRPERWFQMADWWRGRPFFTAGGSRTSPNGSQIVFASGGFWALSTEAIKDANIPDVRLNHNGGDITIGAQVTQAGYKVVDFSPRPHKSVICWSDHPRRGYREDFPWAKWQQTG